MTQFAFDSRDNHLKISSRGTYSDSASSFGTSSVAVNHGLGYIPNVRGFYEPTADEIWPLTENFWPANPNTATSFTSTDSTTTFRLQDLSGGSVSIDGYYSIYEEGRTNNPTTDFTTKKSTEIFSAGPITGSFTAAAGPGGIGITYTTHSITNPVGEKQLPIMRWSLDGTNWVDQDIYQYETSGVPPKGTGVIAYCDNSNIKFQVANSVTSSRTIYYEVYLMQITSGGILLDSRKKTLLNFDEGSKDVVISGNVSSGSRVKWETTIPVDNDAIGSWYVSRSDVANKEWSYPYRPLDFVFDTLSMVTKITYNPTSVTITTEFWNQGAGTRTIPTTTITYRYALFKV